MLANLPVFGEHTVFVFAGEAAIQYGNAESPRVPSMPLQLPLLFSHPGLETVLRVVRPRRKFTQMIFWSHQDRKL